MNMDSRKYGPLKHIEKAFLMGEEGFSFDWFLGKPAASTIYGFAKVNGSDVPVCSFLDNGKCPKIQRKSDEAVAQLGERRVRNAKVGSSILLRSTINLERRFL